MDTPVLFGFPLTCQQRQHTIFSVHPCFGGAKPRSPDASFFQKDCQELLTAAGEGSASSAQASRLALVVLAALPEAGPTGRCKRPKKRAVWYPGFPSTRGNFKRVGGENQLFDWAIRPLLLAEGRIELPNPH